jgi:polysaccharide pyruvyl transferase WcaK-like protein
MGFTTHTHSHKKQVKIGLMGPFGYGNLGDAATQEAVIHNIRAYFENVEIFGYTLDPEDTQKRHGIRSFPISRQSWLEKETEIGVNPYSRLVRSLQQSPNPKLQSLSRWMSRLPLEFKLLIDSYRYLKGIDCLIMSGSGQLTDYWGGGGPWSFPYTFLKWALLARLRGAKFMVVSVGAGPVDARLSRLFFKWMLSLANYRSYRDEFSNRYVRDVIGFSGNAEIYPDMAHSLDVTSYNGIETEKSRRPVVAVGPIGYYKNGCWPERDDQNYADYLEKMSSFVAWLIGRGCSIVFIRGEAHYDKLVIDDLVEVMRGRVDGDVCDNAIDGEVTTVESLLTTIAYADMVVASRFHNVLFSLMLGKPVLAISYQAKIDALMDATNNGKYCVPIKSFSEQDLRDRFLSLEQDGAKVAEQAGERLQRYRDALNEQYRHIFSSIGLSRTNN